MRALAALGVAAAVAAPLHAHPCAFVLTHQLDILMAATERRLAETPALEGVPLFLLRADSFGRLTDGLLARATAVLDDTPRWFPVDTDEVHLAGGYLDLCLKVTVERVLETVFRSGERREARLVVHADLVYLRGGAEPRTLWDVVAPFPSERRLSDAAAIAGRNFFPFYPGIAPSATYRPWKDVSPQENVVRYERDGRFVTVVAVAEGSFLTRRGSPPRSP